nr:MAG TPA: hypothetical protein [Caudoviricetes sp.]
MTSGTACRYSPLLIGSLLIGLPDVSLVPVALPQRRVKLRV